MGIECFEKLIFTESAARRELERRRYKNGGFCHGRFGIRFNHLYTLANMPIRRFGHTLIARGELDQYLDLLERSHRPENLERVMCRTLISVDWRGCVYDCDFNQMLGLPMSAPDASRVHLRDLVGQDLEGRPIAVRGHCYGCTAGQGSSCGGALTV